MTSIDRNRPTAAPRCGVPKNLAPRAPAAPSAPSRAPGMEDRFERGEPTAKDIFKALWSGDGRLRAYVNRGLCGSN